MKTYDLNNFRTALELTRRPFHDDYFAMYSSLIEGIVTDPVLMLVPVDDHLVHRGDGAFETFKCVEGRIYNLDSHLERLMKSVATLEMTVPGGKAGVKEAVIQTVRAGGAKECSIRVLISRGPGSFGVNPYECEGPQLYVAVTRLNKPFMIKHPAGARVATSRIPAKPPYLASIKSCNYLPNVLMKKEAVDRRVDFVVAMDAAGYLAEGATENMGIVTRDGCLLFPCLDGILQGTTMMRAVALAEALVKGGQLKRIAFEHISQSMILEAREVIFVGTTSNVIAVSHFNDQLIGDGQPGEIYRRLWDLLDHDMRHNQQVLTAVW